MVTSVAVAACSPDNQCRFIIENMVSALHHLHSHGYGEQQQQQQLQQERTRVVISYLHMNCTCSTKRNP
jgi:hypothetical protein